MKWARQLARLFGMDLERMSQKGTLFQMDCLLVLDLQMETESVGTGRNLPQVGARCPQRCWCFHIPAGRVSQTPSTKRRRLMIRHKYDNLRRKLERL